MGESTDMLRRIQLSALLATGGILLLAAFADSPKPVTKHQSYTESLDYSEGKITFEMIAVPGGDFVMGSPTAEAGRKEDEGPQVKVKIKPFWIGKCEVTWDEFDRYFRDGNLNLKSDAEDGDKKEEAKKEEPK